jgi:hypothetical protein
MAHNFSPDHHDDEWSIGAWFERAGRLSDRVIAHCMTIDEAATQFVATITGTEDLRRLRRAAWDAEIVLGTETLMARLLHATVQQVVARSVAPDHQVPTSAAGTRSSNEKASTIRFEESVQNR